MPQRCDGSMTSVWLSAHLDFPKIESRKLKLKIGKGGI